ncbi:hypothetical protein I4F81_002586 [Pyropia yezoensis]|uniref:Uncharacterized protein n=1 Tax=Pyropia yezoensis TaxID=2788 RepID=A0ACC3BPX1_PYRYE|nr:hypothetical protein I4F81_002586 [Neopyropia yezoensis]
MPSSGAARRWGARRVVLAVSAATASAVAAAAVAAAKIPFPSPTAARLGYLHRLPAMQCDTATPMAANGSRGLLIERAGGRAFFPLGPQTCAPPLRTWGPRVSAAAVEIEDGKAVVNLGSQSGFRARLARMIRKQSQDGHLRDLVYLPLAKEGDGEQDRGLYQAAAVAEVLSMRRNSYAGAMHRATGDFDVLAVSRLTVGYFLDDLLLGAVDVIGTSRRDVRRVSRSEDHSPIVDLVSRLSQAYDATVFNEEPPTEPAKDSDILLTVLVVFPEAVGLVALWLSTSVWRQRDLYVLLLIVVAGLVSLLGLIMLAVVEHQSSLWRVAALRDDLAIPITPSKDATSRSVSFRDSKGMELYHTETVLLVARTGYRVGLLAGLAVGFSILYLAGSLAIVWAATARWRRGAAPEEPQRDSHLPPPVATPPPASVPSSASLAARRQWRKLVAAVGLGRSS